MKLRRTPKEVEYRNLSYDPATGRIEGERSNEWFDGDSWFMFRATRNLFLIDEAIRLYPNQLQNFMSMADGYGEPGNFPGGYDWSGIRDSSAQAKVQMMNFAEVLLKGRTMPWGEVIGSHETN